MKNVIVLGVLFATISVEATDTPTSKPGCKFWKELSRNLSHLHEKTTDVVHMQCSDNACAEIECSGRIHESVLGLTPVNIELCFGLLLNHCDSPISMNYYVILPGHNVSIDGKITHNERQEFPGISVAGVTGTVIITSEMVRVNASYIKFGVEGQIRIMLAGVPIWAPEEQIFPTTLIDMPPCDNKTPGTSRPPFVHPVTCKAVTPPVTQKPPVTASPHVNSKTYHQVCEFGLGKCAPNVEMCTVKEKSRNGICTCIPDETSLSSETGRCETIQAPTIKGTGTNYEIKRDNLLDLLSNEDSTLLGGGLRKLDTAKFINDLEDGLLKQDPTFILHHVEDGLLKQDPTSLLNHVEDGLLKQDPTSLLNHVDGGLLKSVQGAVKPNTSRCACLKYNCGCCMHLEWEKISLNDTVCANFSYLPAPVYGISMTLSLDNKIIFSKTVSVRNPPPACVAIPYLKDVASLCLRFYNISFTNRTLSACVDLEAKLAGIEVEKLHLGCFQIPPSRRGENYGRNGMGYGGRVEKLDHFGLKLGDTRGVKLPGSKGGKYDSDKLYFKSMKKGFVNY